MEDFKRLFIESLGEEIAAKAFPALFGEENGITAVRFNSRKCAELQAVLPGGSTASDFAFSGLSLGERVPWTSGTYYLAERPNFAQQPLFNAGLYYVQDPSCTYLESVWRTLYGTSAANSSPQVPKRVLDLCAAPGGKSTHLADLMNERGLLVSNEVISSRAATLAENMAKWGVANSVVTNSDPSAFSKLQNLFDLILVDAPCSGEGMFRKNPDAIGEWSLNNVKLCAQRQRRILNDIWPALKQGGYLIYSTCTFNHLENADNVQYIVEELGAEVIPLAPQEWELLRSCGVEAVGEGKAASLGYQFLPGLARGEGQFFAILRKRAAEEAASGRDAEGACAPERELRWHKEIKGDLLKLLPEQLVPEIKLLSKHLRIVSSGRAVATMLASKRGGVTLVPHADLALSLHIGTILDYLWDNYKFKVERVELPLEQIQAFLAKEPLLLPDAPTGYLLLTYKGAGVGFVKNLGNRCNSLLPNARRIKM
ncbi:MAG: RsmB/NOP family class I SAM-dependent RNA methyltransferase [Candidatus Egerieousia sp.]|nr:RsmB/NOP family class I SAM-dependent RNA methyltransferase [Candidatus Egerieousia sp.]